MIQYVEINSAPDRRHVVKTVMNGKGKKGKQALTACGIPFGLDDAIIFAQPSGELMGQPAAAACPACTGDDEPAAPPVPIRLELLDVDAIERSPLNHRHLFSGIEELGADIKANGLRVPIKVRPCDDSGKHRIKWQLVYGERRWRAAKAAGVKQLPALVAELDDLAVVKEQLVENVSRSDVHPLEEADGYQALLETHGYTVERIAKETGKSRTAVYNRLKLRELPTSARDAFFGGQLSASIAELIARIPVAALRDEATRDILRGKSQDKWALDQIFDEIQEGHLDELTPDDDDEADRRDRLNPAEGLKPDEAQVPLTVREAEALIKRRYMLRLELAPFDTGDESLRGGACSKCVHRTGNQPDLFGDVPSADVCTNPPCYEEKRKAGAERKLAAVKAAGLKVLPEKEAEKILNADGSLAYSAPYLDLDREADWEFQEVVKAGGGPPVRTEKTWREILAGAGVPEPKVALDERGRTHELVDKKQALAALSQAGRMPEQARSSTAARTAGLAREKAEREKQAIKVETATRAIAQIAEETIKGPATALWLAECAIRQASMEAHVGIVKRRGIPVSASANAYGRQKNEDALLKYARGLKGQAALESLVLELLAWESAAANHMIGYGTNLTAAAKVFRFDLAKIRKTVEADRKQAAKPAAAKHKATATKPAKKPAAKPAKKKGRKS